jgi:hypothetical protein
MIKLRKSFLADIYSIKRKVNQQSSEIITTMNLLTLEQGEAAVRLARAAIINHLTDKPDPEIPDDLVFHERRGVFVTLNTRKHELRGCIGRPYPIMPLGEAIIVSAQNAATEDPRFPKLTLGELENTLIEVTVLTTPEKLDVKPVELPQKIEIGRHGLIVKHGYYQGLLLPQVATEYNFDAEEFLSHTCMKAGLPPDCWLAGAEIHVFEGQIFEEVTPDGEVRERTLKE